MKIISVVGARPNFMKIAPIFRVLEERRKKLEDIIRGQSTVSSRQKEDKLIEKGEAQSNTNNSLPTIDHLICHTVSIMMKR